MAVEMIWNADNAQPDTINYYLPDAALNLGSVRTTVNTATFNQSLFDTFSIAVNSSTSALVDQIRFGASYNDVITAIPEPSTQVLLGLLGFIPLLIRRR